MRFFDPTRIISLLLACTIFSTEYLFVAAQSSTSTSAASVGTGGACVAGGGAGTGSQGSGG
jgi:hypothetical protein